MLSEATGLIQAGLERMEQFLDGNPPLRAAVNRAVGVVASDDKLQPSSVWQRVVSSLDVEPTASTAVTPVDLNSAINVGA
jgi:hypothetical protein